MSRPAATAGAPAVRRLRAAALLKGAAAIGLALALLGPGPAAAAGSYPEARRVVAVGGSVTEIVYALGEEARLVARDTTSTFPPEALALPDVGYVRQLSPEGLLSVDPDLIIAEAGSGPAETVQQMKASALPFIMIPDADDGAGVAAKIRAVGAALGVEARAGELAARAEADIAAAAATAAQSGTVPRVLFIISLQGGRVMAAGQGTKADAIIRLAGAENAVEGFEGYKPLSDEAVAAAAPEVILMMDRTGDHGATAETLFALPALSTTPAARDRRLVQMDGMTLLGFGPRTAQAIRELSGMLHAPRP